MTATGELMTATSSSAVRPRRLEVVLAAILIVAFVVARSMGVGAAGAAAWAICGVLVALASPLGAGLAVAALGPFDDWGLPDTEAGARSVMVAALAASVALRAARPLGARLRRRGVRGILHGLDTTGRWAAVALTCGSVVLVGTALGVVHSALRFGSAFAVQSAALWATGPGTAMAVLLLAAWFGARGERGPLYSAVGAAVVAMVIAVIQRLAPDLIAASPFAWLIVTAPDSAAFRLAGVTTSAIAIATLGLMPLAMAGGLLVYGPARTRAWVLIALPALLLAVVATLSRSALVVVAAGAALFAARLGRRAALVALGIGLAAAVVLIPVFLAVRNGGATDAGSQPLLADFLTFGDRERLMAWEAALRMGLGSPLVGHGFRSFLLLHVAYGGGRIQAPHDEWLRFFAEEGLIVAAAGVGLVVFGLATLWQGRTAIVLGAFGTLLGYAFMATFNNPLNYAQVNIPIFMVIGTCLGLSLTAERRQDVRPAPSGP